METGYVRLYRQILDTSFFNNSHTFHLFIHLLLTANWKEKKTVFNGEEIIIKRGSLIFGRKKTAVATGICESTIYDNIKTLEKLNTIQIKSNNKFSIITIVNYNKYNPIEEKATTKQQQSNNKNPKKQQQSNTSKELKELNIEHINIKQGDSPFLCISSFYNTLNQKKPDKFKIKPAKLDYRLAREALKTYTLEDLKAMVDWYFNPSVNLDSKGDLPFWYIKHKTFKHFVSVLKDIETYAKNILNEGR
jgi:hypothetical protein